MSVQKHPRKRDPERTTADLLAAAESEFAEHGFAGARVDRIAAAAGCNKALIFSRFGDKEGLYRGVFAATHERWFPTLAELVGGLRADSRGRFAASVELLVDWAIEFLLSEPQIARIALWEIASDWAILGQPRPGVRKDAACPDHLEQTEQIRHFLEAADRSGFLRPDLSSEMQISLVTQIPMVLSAMKFDLTDPAVKSFITDFIVTGLVVPER